MGNKLFIHENIINYYHILIFNFITDLWLYKVYRKIIMFFNDFAHLLGLQVGDDIFQTPKWQYVIFGPSSI